MSRYRHALRRWTGEDGTQVHIPDIILYIWIPAGPTRTTNTPGKMNSSMGITILTAVLAAGASAS